MLDLLLALGTILCRVISLVAIVGLAALVAVGLSSLSEGRRRRAARGGGPK